MRSIIEEKEMLLLKWKNEEINNKKSERGRNIKKNGREKKEN